MCGLEFDRGFNRAAWVSSWKSCRGVTANYSWFLSSFDHQSFTAAWPTEKMAFDQKLAKNFGHQLFLMKRTFVRFRESASRVSGWRICQKIDPDVRSWDLVKKLINEIGKTLTTSKKLSKRRKTLRWERESCVCGWVGEWVCVSMSMSVCECMRVSVYVWACLCACVNEREGEEGKDRR